ncbi:hypothetical protein BB559_000681 [Furculomyces boomerangus]|uniref:Rho-GAP domain-containing protein n=2 Tax=Harpellales TaxID=61421 RepID=A0A2T9Z4L5_9FUNG|nr:hypothetical protein BB559_000681 [Furculomyces boomerangus]PVZ99645.1 hypothetical protein BB558_004327 [Smittium angustum]
MSNTNYSPIFQTSSAELPQDLDPLLIYQAGYDFDSQPLIVFNSCLLPDPQLISNNDLLNYVKEKMKDVVSKNYSLVFFAGGIKYKPSWGWLLSTYQSLERDYKKNLKSLYVVHSTLWTRMLFNIFGTLLSNKFFKKLVWVNNLKHLRFLVPMKHMNIPLPVKTTDETLKGYKIPDYLTSEEHILSRFPNRIFGRNIESIIFQPKNNESNVHIIPKQILNIHLYIYEKGLNTEGIFRVSPSLHLLNEAKFEFDCEAGLMDLDDLGGIHTAAVLLKTFFKELPTSIFNNSDFMAAKEMPTCESPCSHHDTISIHNQVKKLISSSNIFSTQTKQRVGTKNQQNYEPKIFCDCCSNCSVDNQIQRVIYIKSSIISKKSPKARQLLAHLFGLLNAISENSTQNKMNSGNLSLVWSPNLYFTENVAEDISAYFSHSSGRTINFVVNMLIQHFEPIFQEELELFEKYSLPNTDNNEPGRIRVLRRLILESGNIKNTTKPS